MDRKKLKRMSKSANAYILIAILLVLLLIILGTSVFLNIIEINVSGASIYDADEIIKVSGIETGSNMLFVDKDGVKEKIFAEMPYINDISVELSLPDKVEIIISETKMMAAIDVSDGFLLIDSKCKVLEKVGAIPAMAIEVKGFTPVDAKIGSALKASPGDDTRLRYIEEVLAAIDTAGIREGVSYLDVTNIGNVNLGYMDLYTVVLSGSSGAASKLGKLPEAIVDVRKDANFDNSARYRIDIPDSSSAWIWTPEW